jgi:hypothetical protein
MSTWDELRPVLRALGAQRPRALTTYPDPESGMGKRPPFRIELAPWASESAAELHRQFGDDVKLTVGVLPYPPGRSAPPAAPDATGPEPPLLDPYQVTATLDGPAVIRSGHTLTHGLLLGNLTGSELRLPTNGELSATVIDPETGAPVGGFVGWQTQPLVIFRAAPGETVRVPLLIGTASYTLRLGYAIPPGDWQVQARVTLGPHPGDSPVRLTPRLPLTVTS